MTAALSLRDIDRMRLAQVATRAALGYAGGFNGARTDRKALSQWSPYAGSADGDGEPDRATLIARSRDLERNEPFAAGAINTNVTSVVGSGIVPQPRIDREMLGLTEEQADAWERHALRIWNAWSDTPACDITGRCDFASLTELTLRAELASGDVFAIRRFDEQPGEILGLKLQMIEADRVSNPNWSPDTDRMVGGVELDEKGRPIAYHVTTRHPGDSFGLRGAASWTRIPAFGAQSGDRQVLHVYRQTRPGQTRGIPYLAAVIEPIKQLGRYSDAELMAAVISSFFTVFIKTEGGESASGLLGPTSSDAGDDPTLAVDDAKLGAGIISSLAPGESIETANPGRPNAQYDPFVSSILRQVGVALELPYELLVKQFNSSYSASRAALLEAWRMFNSRRNRLVRSFCQPAYTWCISEAVARGIIAAPGFLENPLIRRAWLGTQWTGPSQGQIDPEGEIAAAAERVRLGVSTLQEVTAEMTGGDWERKHPQRVKEERMREEAGLSTPAPAADPAAVAERKAKRDGTAKEAA